MRRHPAVGAVVALLALAATTVACTPSTGNAPASGSPTQPATSNGDLAGTEVHVLGLWSGPELAAFETVVAAWEEDTGGSVVWRGTHDPSGALAGAVEAGDPPDVAIVPNVRVLREMAESGSLIPLDTVLDMGQVSHDYAPAWRALGSHDGELYGIFAKLTSKSTVWYSPTAFASAGYRVPQTWQDLLDLADAMVADGGTPFSVVAQSGPASGWPLTDWVSQMVLTGCGPDLFDAWVTGGVPWTDPCVRQAFEAFSTLVQTPGYVLGGVPGILGTTDAEGGTPLYTDPPGASMYPMASFAQAFIAARYPALEPGADYDVFPFPPMDAKHDGALTVGADVLVMVTDTPAARSLVTYLAGAPAQQTWVELGGFTSVNRDVPLDAYGDPVATGVAEQLVRAEVSRFSAGDMMAPELQRAWWAAMLRLVQEPGALDAILIELTNQAQSGR